MKEIVVAGLSVHIDPEDFDKVMRLSWHITANGYVAHKSHQQSWLLHRYIMCYTGPLVVDHIDRNPLNNQKRNLRVVEQWVNNLNAITPSHNTSGIKGVSYNSRTGSYEAYISINDVKKHIGTFKTLNEAADARQEFELKMLEDPSKRQDLLDAPRKNNKSGVIGVSLVARTGKWKAKLGSKHLGFFDSFDAAVGARKLAELGL